MAFLSLTLFDSGTQRLRALCNALEFDAAHERRMVDVFAVLSSSWGQSPADAPRWRSDITDDSSPFEFSVAFDDDEPELRFLIEVQGAAPSVASNWEASQAVNARLERDFGVSLDRLRAIEDLFAPTEACTRFSLWHAVCFRRGAAPEFKIYLNPAAQGGAKARALVATAMDRLGFGGVIDCLPASDPLDEVCYFSLDLSGQPEARVKVYTAHHSATPERIDAALRSARGHRPGQAADFCRAMASSNGPFCARPVLTCLAFVKGSTAPSSGTVHFPVRSYAANDLIARDRILGCLPAKAASMYRATLEAFALRPLADGIGMQAYASFRERHSHGRLTIYLAPEVYAVASPIRELDERRGTGIVRTPDGARARFRGAKTEA